MGFSLRSLNTKKPAEYKTNRNQTEPNKQSIYFEYENCENCSGIGKLIQSTIFSNHYLLVKTHKNFKPLLFQNLPKTIPKFNLLINFHTILVVLRCREVPNFSFSNHGYFYSILTKLSNQGNLQLSHTSLCGIT